VGSAPIGPPSAAAGIAGDGGLTEGQEARVQRILLDVTQQEVARLARVTQVRVSEYELDRLPPPVTADAPARNDRDRRYRAAAEADRGRIRKALATLATRAAARAGGAR
jgi:hypothetical protein